MRIVFRCKHWEQFVDNPASGHRSPYGQSDCAARRPTRRGVAPVQHTAPAPDRRSPLTEVARVSGIPLRTLQRWTSRYQRFGLAGLARAPRSDAGQRRLSSELVELIEGLALHKPRLSTAAIHRRIIPIVKSRDWPVLLMLRYIQS